MFPRSAPTLPLLPCPDTPGLTRAITGRDQHGAEQILDVVEERPLTIYLNAQEIVTAMTIGDWPDYLALGFLLGQGMLRDAADVTAIDYDDELGVVVVRTKTPTNVEARLEKRTRTSGCAVGTVFGDMMEGLEDLTLPPSQLAQSALYRLAFNVNQVPSLYLKSGAIHGTALCKGDEIIAYFEDVGRHNAVDKVAGFIAAHGISTRDKVLYTTGRLTSEMVIKTALIGVPILASRSGFTAWGAEIASQVDLTLIGRLRGQRFVCLSGDHRLVRDAPPSPKAAKAP